MHLNVEIHMRTIKPNLNCPQNNSDVESVHFEIRIYANRALSLCEWTLIERWVDCGIGKGDDQVF